ncbi:4-aminobutyrate aminotransferase [Methylobacterium sp. NEAU 140]|uniref:4-aminobutyrate aminotransferase n=1 Tax=Methylobacterium sp. NEAU 140 TaxID=3064945 RepID=UPI0027373EE9|nr:4-aminobutyrate aminotransferase [Methylobacterium sp. NEAU 140]MDP4023631.1 4-aminobutyrate aminotransferase [Methylobacterium sp. NEAU 140]
MTAFARPLAGPLLALAAGGLLLAGPALAQTTVTRSKSVASGQTVRLEIAPNLKKDCNPGPMPEIKVSGAPKNGSVITKVGKLKTPAGYRCPNKEAAVQALFYQAKAGYTGADEVTFEVKNSDGQVQTQTIKITVEPASSKAGSDAKKEGTDL